METIRPLNFNNHRYELKNHIYRRIGDMVLVLYILASDENDGKTHNVLSIKIPYENAVQPPAGHFDGKKISFKEYGTVQIPKGLPKTGGPFFEFLDYNLSKAGKIVCRRFRLSTSTIVTWVGSPKIPKKSFHRG